MKNSLVKIIGIATCMTGLSIGSAVAVAGTNVVINGYHLNQQELRTLEVQIGTRIIPGNYIANFQTGCWMNMETGQGNCNGQGSATNQQYSQQSNQQGQYQGGGQGSGAYTTRWGSGEQYSNGSWSHYDSLTGNGGVGGTADGCVYAYGWSNC